MSHGNFMTDFNAFKEAMKEPLAINQKINGSKEMRYRMDASGLYVIKLFDSTYLREYRLASWRLVQLPGCCGILISTDAQIYPNYQKKGWGKIFNKVRQKQATLMGYGQLMCTVDRKNTAQQKILSSNGWVLRSTMTNPKTSNQIDTFTWHCPI